MSVQQPDGPDLGSVLGMGDHDVRLRLGDPVSDRLVAGVRWLVYAADGWRLRLRLSGAPRSDCRVRSLTLDLDDGGRSLEELLGRLGLETAGPIEPVPRSEGRMLRCEVAARSGPASLTARVSGGSIRSVTVFDEPPDWTGEARA
ncbi:MAG: hypothetical protein R3195_10600 [Gemmatimonadota bacterium]|nr:hypothetical protein [Gemmatimonadota bacterium]